MASSARLLPQWHASFWQATRPANGSIVAKAGVAKAGAGVAGAVVAELEGVGVSRSVSNSKAGIPLSQEYVSLLIGALILMAWRRL